MPRILVVDGDAKTAQCIAANLSAHGHTCAIAVNGKDALKRARTSPLDLVILEVMLPGGVSGFEVCRQIRADADLYVLPILIVSAMSCEEEIQHGFAQGADDYIGKPFDMRNLIQRMDMLLSANTDIMALDGMTALPGWTAMKRELQHMVRCMEEFVIAAVELAHLRDFTHQFGSQARVNVIGQLARILKEGASAMPDSCTVGHMGGGYFLCLLPSKHAHACCEQFVSTWRENLATLYTQVGQAQIYRDAVAAVPLGQNTSLIDIMVYSTTYHQREHVSQHELFETLTQLRHKALSAGISGIHVDRRRYSGVWQRN